MLRGHGRDFVSRDFVSRDFVSRDFVSRDFVSRDLGRGAPIASEADPRWDAKMRRIEDFRAVKARAADLGLKIRPIG